MKTIRLTTTIGCSLLLVAVLALGQDTVKPKYAPAQAMLDQIIKDHPEILVIAMHVTPPGAKANVIIASRFNVSPGKWEIQRVDKEADEDDMRVVKTGKPNLEVNATGDRFEVEAAMLDGAGKIIGAVGIVFPYKKGDDQKALQRKGEAIRDEIRKRTPTITALFAKSSF
jgi:iron complex outermembrane receptor protein